MLIYKKITTLTMIEGGLGKLPKNEKLCVGSFLGWFGTGDGNYNKL